LPPGSNAAIAGELEISEKTVESASAQLFRKLGLEPSPDNNRRVLAVLTLLRSYRGLPALTAEHAAPPVHWLLPEPTLAHRRSPA
jgi:Bacterial regulatory proteins, luxR family